MFCYQCGTKVNDGMQFCPCCGTRVISEGTSVGDQNPRQMAKSDMLTIPILGEIARFDHSIEAYVELRKTFEELGQELAKEFTESFYSKYRDIDVFVRNFPKDFQSIFKEATDNMNWFLSEIKIFGVTQDEIAPYTEKYCYRTYLETQEILEQYHEIVSRQEGMREYRQERKDSRGRLVGGGFGLRGVAKGIATAGAVNMATGALHSVGNAIGNMGSAISAANAKDKLFKSGIVNHLGYAIQNDVLGVHLVTVEIINARQGATCCKFTEEDEKQANKILSDLEQSLISDDNKRSAIIRLLTIYPFNPDYYQTAVKLFPNEVEKLRSFADFFGFDIDRFYGDMRELIDPAVEILLAYRDELDNLLIDDLDCGQENVEPLTTNLIDMITYFGCIFAWADEKGFFFLPNRDEKGRARLNGAKLSYAHYGNETPFILYDATLGKSGKDGFLVTNKYVYLKSTRGSIKLPLHDAINDIRQEKDSSNNCNYLYFRDYRVHLLNSGDMVDENILGDFVEVIISLILFLTTLSPQEKDLWRAISQYQCLPPPKQQNRNVSQTVVLREVKTIPAVCYCFECGAENDSEDKFCCECDAELI